MGWKHFLKNVWNKYNFETKLLSKDFYRICEVDQNISKNNILTIQVIGKAALFKCSPEELINNDNFLEGFSRKDVKLIAYLAYQRNKISSLKIESIAYNQELKKTLFKIKKTNLSKTIISTTDEILNNNELFSQLSSEDLKKISYVFAQEEISKEKNEISALKSLLRNE
jgi:hypothetical protein